jgi:integrase
LTGWRASFKHDSPWLFPSHKLGQPTGTRTIRRWADKISEQIGVDALSPHVLRKTYSTMLDAMNVSPMMIAQLVGHSHLRTTKTHYIHHDMNTLTRNLDKIRVPGITH